MSPLARRSITLPVLFIAWGLVTASLPVTLLGAVITDALSGWRRSAARGLLFIAWYLSCEVFGVVTSGVVWAFAPRLIVGARRWKSVHYRLQLLWARLLWAAATGLFKLRVDVTGAEQAAPGPVLVLVRHVSVGDTLLPSIFVTGASGVRLRFVLKDELLWTPCLDIVGNRLPNVFVTRGSGDSERERQKVGDLAKGLDENEGLLIFPEGTRFTAGKRARLLARAEERGDQALLTQTRALTHVLPPRMGGVQAALDGSPDADVVFCAHTGFEDISTMGDIFDGSLVGRPIRVRFWRVPRAALDEDGDWLMDQWRVVDDWVGGRDLA